MSGTRLAAVNVGAEPADHPVTRRFFASAARATSYCSYRDEFSRRSMVTMGVRHEDAPVLPDLVLGVQRSDAAESTPSDIVCVGIMAYYGPRDDKVRGAGLHASYVERVGEFCSWVAGRGYVLRLLVGDVVDEAVGERIRERVLAEHPEVDATRVTVMSCTTLDAVMDDVAGCRIVVAARYHNLVCSLRMARPTIAIGYGGKHDDLLERAGLAGNSEHISAFTVSWLTQRFLDLEGRQQAIVADLVRRNARMRRELDAQYDDLRRGVLGVSPGTSPRPALPLQDVVAHH
jgi:polysaccharide pyruvyl transferase WcaK-like protein